MREATTEAEERFEQVRKRLGLWLAPLLGLALWLAPLPLAPAAHTLAAIFAFTIVLWMTEAIPMPAAGLIGPILLVLGGVAPMEKAFSAFGHPVIFLFLGSFMLALAMQKHGLDRRIAGTLLRIPAVSRSPLTLLVSFGLLTAVLSMWMSNTAITAVMLPIVLGILRTNDEQQKSQGFAPALILTVAFAASIGGLATPVGTPTNLVALGQLERFGLQRPDFLGWMKLGLPITIALLLVLLVMMRMSIGKGIRIAPMNVSERLPALTRGEANTAVVFAAAIALWILPGIAEILGFGKIAPVAWMKANVPEELVGLCAGVALFLLPTNLAKHKFTLEWRDTANVDWGTLLMFGGGFALGHQIKETGLARAIGDGVAIWMNHPSEGVLIGVAIVVSIMLSEATSNVASANVMIPLMIGVAQSTGADPQRVALASCLACSLGFMLPISTPPNALAYGTGLVRIPTMMRYGLLLDIAGGCAVWVCVKLFV
jgi:solute carrier family 13 (sodium-dependent dicarboxylate transporter), member 2/3/5